MTITMRKMCWRRAVMFIICMWIPGCLAAQTAPRKAQTEQNRTAQTAAADPRHPILAVLQSEPTMTLTLSVLTTSCRLTFGKRRKYPKQFRFARMAKYRCL